MLGGGTSVSGVSQPEGRTWWAQPLRKVLPSLYRCGWCFLTTLNFLIVAWALEHRAELTIKSSSPSWVSPLLPSEAGSFPHLPTSSLLTWCWAPVRTQHRLCTSSAVFLTSPLFNVLCSYPETPESSGTSHQSPFVFAELLRVIHRQQIIGSLSS